MARERRLGIAILCAGAGPRPCRAGPLHGFQFPKSVRACVCSLPLRVDRLPGPACCVNGGETSDKFLHGVGGPCTCPRPHWRIASRGGAARGRAQTCMCYGMDRARCVTVDPGDRLIPCSAPGRGCLCLCPSSVRLVVVVESRQAWEQAPTQINPAAARAVRRGRRAGAHGCRPRPYCTSFIDGPRVETIAQAASRGRGGWRAWPAAGQEAFWEAAPLGGAHLSDPSLLGVCLQFSQCGEGRPNPAQAPPRALRRARAGPTIHPAQPQPPRRQRKPARCTLDARAQLALQAVDLLPRRAATAPCLLVIGTHTAPRPRRARTPGARQARGADPFASPPGAPATQKRRGTGT
jgi:hypothetical protein